MAYINVAEWTSDQVVDWLKGLDISMYRYLDSFSNNQVGGEKLLNIRPYILEELGVDLIGHQEIILEAVEYLRNFHYNLDKENLQYLALQLATASKNLYKQLEVNPEKTILETEILKDISRTIGRIKPIICWLDRPPFRGHLQYIEIRKQMLRLGLEMATSAQRGRFAIDPVEQIRTNAEKLAKLSDYIIQDISDPMLLQPASLILANVKKKESDLGFYVSPSFHGIYKVTEIKFNSPAHTSGKIEEGDEIVQINYQTVVGWQHKKVLLQLQESKPDVLLTIKKRPKHMKIYGQIYMKPYRLPSRKRSMANRWGDASSPTDLLQFHEFSLPHRQLERIDSKTDSVVMRSKGKIREQSDDSDSDLLTPTEPKPPQNELHLLLQTSRPFLQRRNTICGDQSSSFKYLGNVKFWQDRRKDKSISMGYGLEIDPTPFLALNGSLPEIIANNNSGNSTSNAEKPSPDNQCDTKINSSLNKSATDRQGVSKVVRFDANVQHEQETLNNKYAFNIENTVLETLEPIPFVDEDEPFAEEKQDVPKVFKPISTAVDVGALNQAINNELIKQRSDLREKVESDEDIPPAIEPRKEFLQQTPPEPPPRPKKPAELSPQIVSLKQSPLLESKPITPKGESSMKTLPEEPDEALELVTPVKTKSLTLKKKNSILAKRRKVTVKSLQHSDIQGHLYRRTKDKNGTSYWAKGYFVLVDNVLYCFRLKDSNKADFLSFLTGFTVSLATEIHSKPFAFKVYHALKTLYFAAETQEALNQWMDYLRQATMKGVTINSITKEITEIKEIFSETDSSGDESEESGENEKNKSDHNESPTIKYHLGLGSLKKFTKSNPFSSNKSDKDKKPSSDIPIPSAQFKSYIKVQGFAGISVNHVIPNEMPYRDFEDRTKPIPNPLSPNYNLNSQPSTPPPIVARRPDLCSTPKVEKLERLEKPEPVPVKPEPEKEKEIDLVEKEINKRRMRKPQPFNYIHASNPNLVDFECHVSSKSTLEFVNPKVNSTWDSTQANGSHSLQGFMTLKDLMLQQQAEDAKEVYNNRVFLGIEKKDDKNLRKKSKSEVRALENHLKITYGSSSNNENNPKIDKIQSRSLPKTPDYAQSFKPDDVDIIMIRSKEGQILRNFGYEFISEENPEEKIEKARILAAKRTDKVSPTTTWSKKKGINWINSDKTYNDDPNKIRGGSFKKLKSVKMDQLKTSSEKIFSFNKIYNDKETNSKKVPGSPSHLMISPLKPVTSYSPMTLPLNKKSNHFFNLGPEHSSSHLKKGYGECKENSSAYDQQRKMSVPEKSTGYFTKLTFASTKQPKEKRIFGSPRLHRAIFGRQHSNNSGNHSPSALDDISLSTTASNTDSRRESMNLSENGPQLTPKVPHSMLPEYPHMECPPVFKPETYSLSDPSTSNTLLRRRNNSTDNKNV